ncbi:MAG TPA: tripartite tricarboxylate transporter TctB family protein [Anaeromyxobacter sp.]
MKSSKDFFAGVVFVAFGALFALGSLSYRMGTAARMGPGYFPLVLGCLLSALGLAILVRGLAFSARSGPIERFRLKPMLFVLVPIAAFTLLLRPAGLVLSVAVLVLGSSRGSHDFRLRESIVNTAALLLLTVAIFVWGLGMQIPLWPGFVGR